jgi:hypothetical protein
MEPARGSLSSPIATPAVPIGFVEMSNAGASRAMQALNGPDFDGRVEDQ